MAMPTTKSNLRGGRVGSEGGRVGGWAAEGRVPGGGGEGEVGGAEAAWAAEGRVAAARTGAGGWSKRTMSPSACPLVQQRWALRRVKQECARAVRREALALLPKLAVEGASAIGSVTLSVKATRSGQEGGGRQSGDGVGGGEVGGERGATRGATACVARAVGCASVVLVRVLRWGCMRRQTWRRRLHKQTAAGRQSRAGAERRGERAASMLSMMSPTNSGGFGVSITRTNPPFFFRRSQINHSYSLPHACMRILRLDRAILPKDG